MIVQRTVRWPARMWTTNTPLTRSLRDQGTEQLINIASTWPGILNLLLPYCLPKFQPKHQVTFVLWPWHQLWHHRRHDLRFPIQTRTLRKWCVLWRRISNIFFVCFPPLWFLRNDYAYFRTRSIQAEQFRKFWVGSQTEHLIVIDSAEISERFEAIF